MAILEKANCRVGKSGIEGTILDEDRAFKVTLLLTYVGERAKNTTFCSLFF